MNLKDFVVADTETTGFDPDKDELVDIGLVHYDDQYEPYLRYQCLIKPTIPIPFQAMAVHHIMNEDVANAPSAEMVKYNIITGLKGRTFVCHNADFDSKFMGKYLGLTSPPWSYVCTWRLAQQLWPDAPGYKNQELRYWRGYGKIDLKGMSPHRAAPDALVTAYIFRDLFEAFQTAFIKNTGNEPLTEDLLRFAAQPIYIKKMPFGKHKDMPIEEVPSDYLLWMLRKIPDLSPDLRYTVRKLLGYPVENGNVGK